MSFLASDGAYGERSDIPEWRKQNQSAYESRYGNNPFDIDVTIESKAYSDLEAKYKSAQQELKDLKETLSKRNITDISSLSAFGKIKLSVKLLFSAIIGTCKLCIYLLGKLLKFSISLLNVFIKILAAPFLATQFLTKKTL